MNKLALSFTFFLFTIGFFSTSTVNVAAGIEENVTIVFTSGMAEIHLDHNQGGYAHLKSLLTTLRTHDDPVLFLHGGEVLSPGVLSTIDKGAHMISILNELSPDALSLSKSDLAHHEDALSLRTYEAGFPLINCNIYDPLTKGSIEGVFPHLLVQAGEFKIGLLSVVDPEVIADYLPQRITTRDSDKAVAENARQLRQKGADIVILMAGLSIDTFNTYFTSPPVDMVLLSQATGEKGLTQQGNSLFELKGVKDAAAIINLHLMKTDTETHWTGTSRLVQLMDYSADPDLDKKIASYLHQHSDILGQVIGMTRTPLDTRRKSIRTGENAFANFTTDSLRDFFQSDIALFNGGGFRADREYPSGSQLTVGDIQKELPFHNKIVNLRVSGKMLKASLENGLSRINEAKGRFPHVSGIRVEYNPAAPPLERVTSIKIIDQPIDPEKLYTLTTVDFLADGGDGYTVLKKAERIVKINETKLLWEYVKNQIVVKGAISPEIDGRMKALHP